MSDTAARLAPDGPRDVDSADVVETKASLHRPPTALLSHLELRTAAKPAAGPSSRYLPAQAMDTTRIDEALQLIRDRRPGAEDELLRLANERVERLSRKFLSAFPTVAAWYETGDVRQLALMRARRTLEKVDVSDAKHFYRLLAKKVRETLLDLKRQLHGPQGRATHERPLQSDGSDSRWFDQGPVDETHEPGKLAQWLELHAAIEALPEPHRQMFDVLWYNELTQEEAANVLGVSVRHVRRLWRDAKLALVAAHPDLHP